MNDVNPQPVDAAIVPRFGSIPTFMRLPYRPDPTGLDIGLVGVPWDGGTTNRAGARHGPREIRNMSSFMRKVHHVSRIAPYQLAKVADIGDAPVNPIDLMDSLSRIEAFFAQIHAQGRDSDLGRRRSSHHLADLPRHREAAADRHDPCRCPFRHQRPLFRRQSLYPWHALPPRGGGGAAGPQARDPDRHPRLDLFRGRHGLRRGLGHARRLYGGIRQARAWSG